MSTAEARADNTAQKETHGFQTEVKQLLDLMVHSLYSNKEIFLRELVSNASDALDKLRFKALSDSSYQHGDNCQIQIDIDHDNKLLIIDDNGIGMSKEEVMQNLGTIAKSGTKAFINSMTGDNARDTQLIGQFGVGFYSVFMVADNVVVETRRANFPADSAVRWQSTGDGSYTTEDITKSSIGTRIIISLKDTEHEFLDPWRVKTIITKYSDHIAFPVVMQKEPEPNFDVEGKPVAEDNQETVIEEYEPVNKATALWLRNKKEITDEEYNEFYKHISHDYQQPLLNIHNKVEGKLEYTTLLYIPKSAPFDLYNRDTKFGLKLYVNRVFIMDDVSQFLPNYLRFVRGIVDSNDLPLNVSREILQQSKAVDSIKNALTKRVLDQLDSMAKEKPEDFMVFWKEFGPVMKEGPAEDHANKERIAKLLRFASTFNNTAEQIISLEDYVSRMQKGQEKIFYIAADTFAQAKNSPYLEQLREKDIEVLLLSDRVDEWLMTNLMEFDGKPLQAINKGELDLGELESKDDKESKEKQQTEFKNLLERVKTSLGDRVKEVRVSSRLKDTPACIIADKNDMGLQLQRIMKAAGQSMPPSKPIFEINTSHPIVNSLNTEQDDTRFNDWVSVLFDQAVLAESGTLEDPASFVNKLNKMLLQTGLGS